MQKDNVHEERVQKLQKDPCDNDVKGIYPQGKQDSRVFRGEF
mgnify:CR=1 FL=1